MCRFPSSGFDLADITTILARIVCDGDDAARELLPLLYDELRRLATAYIRRLPPGQTLQPTDLVHEAFLRMVSRTAATFENRAQFLGVAAHAMREILVDHARAKGAAKRGAGWERVELGPIAAPDGLHDLDVLALNEALERLRLVSERGSRVVELRFFGGLSIAEISTVLCVSHATVEGDWAMARAWLGRELGRGQANGI